MANSNIAKHIMKTNKLLTGITMILLLAGIVNAFGVVGYGSTPIKVRPGESINLSLTIQNMVGGEDYQVLARLYADEGINARIIDESESYALKYGTMQRVNFQVSVPTEAELGSKYNVQIMFTTTPAEEGGAPLGISTVIGENVAIMVASTTDDSNIITPTINNPSEEESNTLRNMVLIATLAIVIALATTYIRRKDSEKK
jgi:hypothetical protein